MTTEPEMGIDAKAVHEARKAANTALNMLVHQVYDEDLPLIGYLCLAGWAIATFMESAGKRTPVRKLAPALQHIADERFALIDKRKAALM